VFSLFYRPDGNRGLRGRVRPTLRYLLNGNFSRLHGRTAAECGWIAKLEHSAAVRPAPTPVVEGHSDNGLGRLQALSRRLV